MKKIVIIGSGNLAWALTAALHRAGNVPIQVFARDGAKAARIASEFKTQSASEPSCLASADIYLLAVSDRALTQVCQTLDFGQGTVAHTAGCVPLEAIPANIADRAVFYPLQTFTAGRMPEFESLPVMVEASSEKALEDMVGVAELLGGNVVKTDFATRSRAHLAAVFAGNFANYMYTVGATVIREAGLDFALLRPLILETARKAAQSDDPAQVQTGPAVRNDFQTKSFHAEMLTEKPDLKNIYINLSKNIWETSKKI